MTNKAVIVGWSHIPFGKLIEPDTEALMARVSGAALEHAGERRAPVLIMQAEILIKHHKLDAALATLEQLEAAVKQRADEAQAQSEKALQKKAHEGVMKPETVAAHANKNKGKKDGQKDGKKRK